MLLAFGQLLRAHLAFQRCERLGVIQGSGPGVGQRQIVLFVAAHHLLLRVLVAVPSGAFQPGHGQCLVRALVQLADVIDVVQARFRAGFIVLGGVGDVVEGFAFVIVLLPGADNPAQDAQAHGVAGGGHDQAGAGHLYGLACQQGTACAMPHLVLIDQSDAEADQPFAVHLR